jgi:hypothetical protein
MFGEYLYSSKMLKDSGHEDTFIPLFVISPVVLCMYRFQKRPGYSKVLLCKQAEANEILEMCLLP